VAGSIGFSTCHTFVLPQIPPSFRGTSQLVDKSKASHLIAFARNQLFLASSLSSTTPENLVQYIPLFNTKSDEDEHVRVVVATVVIVVVVIVVFFSRVCHFFHFHPL
jgi:hypothetical protein